jgi:ankyrin repeat protein
MNQKNKYKKPICSNWFFKRCCNRKCTFLHPKICKFYLKGRCRKKNCGFEHISTEELRNRVRIYPDKLNRYLLKSVYNNDLNSVKIALLMGANINYQSRASKSTPLIMATFSKKNNIAKYLIRCGADVNIINDRDNFALLYAIEGGNFELIKMLVRHGANVNMLKDSFPMLFFALKNSLVDKDKIKIAKFLVNSGATLQSKAVLPHFGYSKDLASVKFLIENGLSKIEEMDCAKNILYNAVRFGNYDIARYIIEKGADVNGSCCELADIETPLVIISAKYGTDSVTELLINNGVNINLVYNQSNLLSWVASVDHEKSALALVNKGVNINGVNCFGETPLMWASKNGCSKVAKTLIEKGANIFLKNNKGETAYAIAIKKSRTNIIKIFESIIAIPMLCIANRYKAQRRFSESYIIKKYLLDILFDKYLL